MVDELRQRRVNESATTIYIILAVVMAVATMICVLIAAVLQPSNASVITTIVGISSPIILGLLAVGLQGIHKLVNGNLQNVRTDLRDALTKIGTLQDEKVFTVEEHNKIMKESAADAAKMLKEAVDTAKIEMEKTRLLKSPPTS